MTRPNKMALAAYRHVLRATRIAFQGMPEKLQQALQHLTGPYVGDQRLLISARHQARSSFALHTSLLPSSPEATAQIAHAEDVATTLRQNVVQGQRADGEGDKYSKFG